MTRFLLLRHGETDWNREGRYQGHADPPLNHEGRRQAEEVGEALRGREIEAIYSSDLQRAFETAQIIGAKLGLEVRPEVRLREVNQGDWEGILVQDIARQFPSDWHAWQRDPVHSRPPGGESVRDVAERVWAAADEIARRHPAAAVLLVSHGLALGTLRCCAGQLPLERAPWMIPENATIEEVDWEPGPLPGPGP